MSGWTEERSIANGGERWYADTFGAAVATDLVRTRRPAWAWAVER